MTPPSSGCFVPQYNAYNSSYHQGADATLYGSTVAPYILSDYGIDRIASHSEHHPSPLGKSYEPSMSLGEWSSPLQPTPTNEHSQTFPDSIIYQDTPGILSTTTECMPGDFDPLLFDKLFGGFDQYSELLKSQHVTEDMSGYNGPKLSEKEYVNPSWFNLMGVEREDQPSTSSFPSGTTDSPDGFSSMNPLERAFLNVPTTQLSTELEKDGQTSTIPAITMANYAIPLGIPSRNDSIQDMNLNISYSTGYKSRLSHRRPAHEPAPKPDRGLSNSRNVQSVATHVRPTILMGRNSCWNVPGLLSSHVRAHPYKMSPRRTYTKVAKLTDGSRVNGYTSSSTSSSATSAPLSRHTSPDSATSVESSGSRQHEMPTQPASKNLDKLVKDRGHLTRLLTRHFKQPSEAFCALNKWPSKTRNSDLVCQWINPFGMRCCDRKYSKPGGLIERSGRKKGFSSENSAEVLRHMAEHREEERQVFEGFGADFDPKRRTVWTDRDIDAQLQLDQLSA